MPKVTYNGLIFPFTNVTDFKHESVYDESGTDYILSKFDISIMCVVNLDYIKLLDPDSKLQGGVTTKNVNLLRSIRQRLMEPRRALEITYNDYNLVPTQIQGNAGSVDAQNGPQPKSCDFTDLSSNTFMLTWRVVAHYWEKLDGFGDAIKNTAGANVLYNRWSDSQDIDENGFTTRTRDGVFAIRSDNPDGQTIDKLRTQMAVVGIPQGFRRISAKYTVQPDGLKMRYSLTDKEAFKMPPEPAKTATGTYTETVGKGEGKRQGHCMVKLQGSKTDSQAELIATAVAVCTFKLGIRGGTQVGFKGVSVIESAKVSYGLYDNWAQCDMQCMYAIDAKRLKGVNAFSNVNTALPFSDGLDIKPSYPAFGTVLGNVNVLGVGLQVPGVGPLLEAAKYYDPSLRGITMEPGGRNLTAGLEIGTAGKNLEPAHYTPQQQQ